MIIVSSPTRVSLGSSDHSPFSERFNGVALSICINKRVYVILRNRSGLEETKFRVSYSKTELCNTIDEIQLSIARAALSKTDFTDPLEIIYASDVPAQTGLGTSSAFALALLKGLLIYKNVGISNEILSEWAYTLERIDLNEKGGWQDQYSLALGGINYLTGKPFNVKREPVMLSPDKAKLLEDHLLLIYTGKQGSSHKMIADQLARLEVNKTLEETLQIKKIVEEMHKLLISPDFHPTHLVYPMRETWDLKKRLSSGMTNEAVDDLERRVMDVNSKAAVRLVGGGGGRGTLLVLTAPECKEEICRAVKPLQCVDVRIDWEGVRARRIFSD